jgi:hypothetical protein
MIFPSRRAEDAWLDEPCTQPDDPDGFVPSPALGFDMTLLTLFIDFQV